MNTGRGWGHIPSDNVNDRVSLCFTNIDISIRNWAYPLIWAGMKENKDMTSCQEESFKGDGTMLVFGYGFLIWLNFSLEKKFLIPQKSDLKPF